MLVIQAEQELIEKELEIYTLKSQLEKYTNPIKMIKRILILALLFSGCSSKKKEWFK